ncbi:molybdopterin-dependent oxidoreductase [Tunturibacter empetritectus]|uniref:DMSO/TMAO reductase YedYZ molybdopterin-dependent catalytic subunit n=1 Tax=Tunturiibacter empetritectus TaxID=3069691 RepID=A0A7W8IN21_9BACT|nr:molybdopterin-dependent oxidoreductase [Edaphobacter lichenicola]MBB5319341.1 DMSO/TMAO reductase YedYZ molybdopterin-dependent catalytic subunit [Edaphobacter lichenicola]
MINEEKGNSVGSEDIPSTSTGSNLETTQSLAAGSEDTNPTAPVGAETRQGVESVEQPANADGSPSSSVGHALQTDKVASSVTAKQEMEELAKTGPQNANLSASIVIERSEAVETIQQSGDADESPSLSVEPAPRIDEVVPPIAVEPLFVKKQQSFFEEQPLPVIVMAPRVLRYRTRRDVLGFGIGAVAAAAGAEFLLPQNTLSRLGVRRDMSSPRKEWMLNKALRIDDDVAEALYSLNRMVPTYTKSHITPIKNNYNGATPDPGYISGWNLTLEGLDSGLSVCLDIRKLMNRFPMHEQIIRFVCVEGWSAIAWWAGLRFDDLLRAYPPMSQAKWARVESSVNLDNSGNPDPYFVSIDLATARHPQTLLVTHLSGQPLTVEHGAPLRLLVPVKLGLKNVKAITRITYSVKEPRDYWTPYGYSSYDGI